MANNVQDVLAMLIEQVNNLQMIVDRLDPVVRTPEPTQEEYRMRVDIARQWVSVNMPFKREDVTTYYFRYMAHTKYHHHDDLLQPADFTGNASEVLGRSPRNKYGDMIW